MHGLVDAMEMEVAHDHDKMKIYDKRSKGSVTMKHDTCVWIDRVEGWNQNIVSSHDGPLNPSVEELGLIAKLGHPLHNEGHVWGVGMVSWSVCVP